MARILTSNDYIIIDYLINMVLKSLARHRHVLVGKLLCFQVLYITIQLVDLTNNIIQHK